MNQPAFPRAGHEWDEMEWVPAPAQNGMTLRDYFAAKAMQSMTHRHEANTDFVARQAYAMADAMMKAREA